MVNKPEELQMSESGAATVYSRNIAHYVQYYRKWTSIVTQHGMMDASQPARAGGGYMLMSGVGISILSRPAPVESAAAWRNPEAIMMTTRILDVSAIWRNSLSG